MILLASLSHVAGHTCNRFNLWPATKPMKAPSSVNVRLLISVSAAKAFAGTMSTAGEGLGVRFVVAVPTEGDNAYEFLESLTEGC